ncbi:hypothetical protein QCA50_014797 [Cerrena zonata]|uniref:F-box domain-containing protein n=1 Tax=Cerrena zonata TaxID=2478898 RepID=A0AAW0FZN3_9APHY
MLRVQTASPVTVRSTQDHIIGHCPRHLSSYTNNMATEATRHVYSSRIEKNRRLPVGRCPVEVLEEIFLYVRDAALSDFLEEIDPTPLSLKDAYRWLRDIALLCQRWKEVAFLCPSLWSIIICGHIRIETVSLFLRRSRRASLRVFVSENSACLSADQQICQITQSRHSDAIAAGLRQTIALLSPHFHRIKSLNYYSNFFPEDLLSVLDAPRLRVLRVGSHHSHFSPRKLPPLFAVGPPPLTTLSVVALPSWPVGPLNVRHLSFHGQSLSDDLFAQCLFDTLHRNPDIQSLALLGGEESAEDALGWVPNSPIHLDQLKSLTLASHPPELISQFLSHLVISECTSIIIDHEDAAYDVGEFLPLDDSHLPGLHEVSEIIVQYGHDTCDLAFKTPDNDSPALVAHGMLNFEDIDLEIFGNIYGFSHIRNLTLQSSGFFNKVSSEFWEWVIENMTSLQSISLENVTPHTLIQFLLNNDGYELPEFDSTSDVTCCTDNFHHGRTVVHSRHSFLVNVRGVPTNVDVVFECRPSTGHAEPAKATSHPNEKFILTTLTRSLAR